MAGNALSFTIPLLSGSTDGAALHPDEARLQLNCLGGFCWARSTQRTPDNLNGHPNISSKMFDESMIPIVYGNIYRGKDEMKASENIGH